MSPQLARERSAALELAEAGSCDRAMPALQSFLASVPTDAAAQEELAMCIADQASAMTDPQSKTAALLRARQEFEKAQQLGDNSSLLQAMLVAIPADGQAPAIARSLIVNGLLTQANSAAAKGNDDLAQQYYFQALLLNPQLFDAALGIGNAYFHENKTLPAAAWFARAVQIDPTKEIAFRYWGDTLLKDHMLASARSKYIDAIICDPYDQKTWDGVNNFLKFANQGPTWHPIKPPEDVSTSNVTADGDIDATAPAPDNTDNPWTAYNAIRLQWSKTKFKQEYPNEPIYRHTLKEEDEALGTAARIAERNASGAIDGVPRPLTPDLAFLVRVYKAGLLDPFILVTNPDTDLMREYPAYKQAHRDLLVRYLNEIVIPPPPPGSR